MSVETALVTLLSDLASGQVYPRVAPPGTSGDYITYTSIGGEDDYSNDGADGEPVTTIQVSCWASTEAAAQALQAAVIAAVNGWSAATIHAAFVSGRGDLDDIRADALTQARYGKRVDVEIYHD